MNILVVGQTTYDTTYFIDHYPAENSKTKTTDKVENPGGGAFNMAALLNKWGKNTTLLSVVGNDIYGTEILNACQQIGLSSDYIGKNEGHTSKASVICNTTSKTRTVIAHYDQNLIMNEANFDFTPDIIIGDGKYPETFKKVLGLFPKAISILDAGRCDDATIELAHLVKYLVTSHDFAEDYTKTKIDLNNQKNIDYVLETLNQDFKNNVIVTIEKRGSIIKINGTIYLIPSIAVEEIDTTGAGDIYHGAFAYGISEGWDLAKTMRYANIAGALSTTKKGSMTSIPELTEVDKIYHENR